MTRIGLPHSEILGSKVVCTSPRLIAAYHVLRRLSVPRHPPYALISLTKTGFQQIILCSAKESILRFGKLIYPIHIQLSKSSRGNPESSVRITTLVEITGIEPVTSGLQSRRSPI